MAAPNPYEAARSRVLANVRALVGSSEFTDELDGFEPPVVCDGLPVDVPPLCVIVYDMPDFGTSRPSGSCGGVIESDFAVVVSAVSRHSDHARAVRNAMNCMAVAASAAMGDPSLGRSVSACWPSVSASAVTRDDRRYTAAIDVRIECRSLPYASSTAKEVLSGIRGNS